MPGVDGGLSKKPWWFWNLIGSKRGPTILSRTTLSLLTYLDAVNTDAQSRLEKDMEDGGVDGARIQPPEVEQLSKTVRGAATNGNIDARSPR